MLNSGVRPSKRRHGLAGISGLAIVAVTALSFGMTGVSAQDSTPAASPTAFPSDLAAGLTFGLIQKSGDQQYFVDEARGFTEIIEGAGGEVIVQDVQLDSNAAISAMDTMIAAGVAGIAIVVPDQAIGPAVIEKAAAAGIPLIAHDDSIQDAEGNPNPIAGFDGVQMGTSVGEEVVRLWQENDSPTDGVGALSVEVQTLSVCNDRTDASSSLMTDAGFPEDQIFAIPYDGTSPSAIDAAATVITAHPEITTWYVWGCNDEGVQGTIRALESAGVTADNTFAVGLGAYLACAEWKSGNPTGFRASLYISGVDVGRTGATALILAATQDEPLPQESFAPTYMVTPEDYEEKGVTC